MPEPVHNFSTALARLELSKVVGTWDYTYDDDSITVNSESLLKMC